MTSDKSLITYSEFKELVNDSEIDFDDKRKKVETSNIFVLLNESQLTSEITSNLKGISEMDIKRIFGGSEIIGTDKRKFYCANAGFLLNVIEANDIK